MLQLKIPLGPELWDNEKEEFIPPEYRIITLEHSLVSLSKWESKWCKPFLDEKRTMTTEESIDYIRCMTITQNVPPDTYSHITQENVDEVTKYIKAPMTATWFSKEEQKKGGAKEIITSELIYYWMIALNIPDRFEKWHLNRLLTLIRICNVKNAPPKKTSKRATANRYAAMNAARRQRLNSKG